MDFSGKRVLVIGTGPSLDKFDQAYFDSFDVHVCINQAYLLKIRSRKRYFFSTDPARTYEVMTQVEESRSEYRFYPEVCIILPNHFDVPRQRKKEIVGSLTWLHPQRVRLQWLRAGKRAITPVLASSRSSNADLKDWLEKKGKVGHAPFFPHTSAISAVAFVAKYRPSVVRLVGCDFSIGRAMSMTSFAGPGAHDFSPAIEEFRRVERSILSFGIDVENESWLYNSEK